jgi:thiamine biosynthesis lipoprotein
MNTEVRVMVPGVGDRQEARLAHAVEARFASIERCFSRFRPDSELSRLNAGGGGTRALSQELFDALVRARGYAELSGGWFDVTVGGALRGLGYDRSFAPGALDRALPPARLQMDPPIAAALKPDHANRSVGMPAGASLDCGGFIKGWAVDQALDLLPAPCAVDAGGDAAVKGAWPVQVEDPWQSGCGVLELELRDQAIATSGINRRRWRTGDVDAHHLIDPFTGRPSESDLVQVSVVAPSAETADVLAKSAFLRGLKSGREFLEGIPNVYGIFITRSNQLHTTSEVSR